MTWLCRDCRSKKSPNCCMKPGFQHPVSICVEQRQALYEQFIQEEIDRDAHMRLKGECTAQIERLHNQLAAYRQAGRDKEAAKGIAGIAKQALSETATPKEIVNALVEKVLVSPGNKIEIYWKFIDFAANL